MVMPIGTAHIVVRAITTGFKKEVSDAVNNITPAMRQGGSKAGNAFVKGLGSALSGKGGGSGGGIAGKFKQIENSARPARDAMNTLIKTGYKLTPAIFGAAAAIGDLIFGLGSLVSAVGRAGPALSVFAVGLSALLQGAMVAKVAFGGVGAAISALMNKEKDQAKNNKQIEDARRRLALIYQKSAESIAAANDKVRKAQIALNAAYKEGLESLQQLGFSAEEAALAQEKAAIELERAREALMRSQDLPTDDRARREAEIAFKEAELNYRKTTDQVNDLREQQEYAARTGVEGTKEVIDAKNKLAEAEADRAKQGRDNAQDIADGQRAVAEAIAASASQADDALKDLSPGAKAFAKYIASLKPLFLSLRFAAGEKLWGPLTAAVKSIVEKLIPVLIPILRDTGRAIGVFAKQFSEMLTSPVIVEMIERIFGQRNVKLIGIFGKIFTNLAKALIKVLDAAGPLTLEFADFLLNLSESAANAQNLEGKINKAGRAAKIIGKSLGSMFKGLKDFFSLGSDAGLKIFEAFGKAGEGLQKFSKNNAEEIREKFDQIADNIIAMGKVLGSVIKLLFDLSGNEGVEIFANKIATIAPMFSDIGNTIVRDTAEPFGDFIVNIAKVIKLFTESGSIKMFFGILNKALEVVIAIFSDENVQKIVKWLAIFRALTLGVGAVYTTFMFFAKAFILFPFAKLVGGILSLWSAFKKLREGLAIARVLWAAFSAATGVTAAPILAIVAAIAALVFIFVMAYRKSENLRKAIGGLIEGVEKSFAAAWANIQSAIKELEEALGSVGLSFESIGDIFAAVGTYISVMVITPLSAIISGIIQLIGGIISSFIRVFAGVIKIGGAIRSAWQGIWSLLTGDFMGFISKMKDAAQLLKDGIMLVLKGIASPIVALWNGIADGINSVTSKIKIDFPDWMPFGLGGKSFKFKPLPKITNFAEGGIVYPRPGGVQAVVAEAGRAERIEPLDSRGLSNRDKAMIQLLAGTRVSSSSGVNVVINPSAGMDERELGMVVSRQIAWQLRRGA